MARELIDTCDPCGQLGVAGMPAERSIMLAIDGPPKRFELCTVHLHQLAPWAQLYQECGVDESLKPKKRGPSRQEVTDREDDTQAQLELTAAEPAPAKKPAADKAEDHIMVSCNLDHANGQPAVVQYRSRNSHAKEAHDGAKVWEIEWSDLSGTLTHACTTHAECAKVKLAFPSATSLSRHIRMCPLEKLPEAD
ncbi:hypothetical protein ACFYP4_02960 [Streptomyces sp. NPDC005551]|uniref:hypothetical protein n=1 Tax=Streptomyces sp. NPDC005551 TaxID=3364725 RepID=UPI0036AB85D4